MDRRVRCVIMRGGTSKSIVFAASDLPKDNDARDLMILQAFGSPDARQINGLGGADPLTSKVAIVAPSDRHDCDVDYTFGQVGILSPTINYKVSCGNTAAAVGVYALEEGLVQAAEGMTRVRIFSTNSRKRIIAEVPSEHGVAKTGGNFHISGVPGTGAEIRLDFLDPAGGVTGRLLPTGAVIDELQLSDGLRLRLSVIDCGNLYAIIPAETWLLEGTELPEQLEGVPGFTSQVEEIREAVCAQLRPAAIEAAKGRASAKLKIAIVGRAASYTTPDGTNVDRSSVDVVARIINQERVHKAFAVTGAICFAAAAAIPGTVVNELCPAAVRSRSCATVRIGHPQGVVAPSIEYTQTPDSTTIDIVRIGRTARRIMDGHVYIPSTAVRS